MVSIYEFGLLILYLPPYFGEHNTWFGRRVSTTAWKNDLLSSEQHLVDCSCSCACNYCL